jgi:dipeptidase D
MILSHLEPAAVFRFFEAISQIPRGSGNEKAVSDYICDFARGKGLPVIQDRLFNLIITKPASSGYENHPPVILQGHLDMVCEKNIGTEHDFLKDPIKLQINGDMISAQGTTLGADNGTAVAMCMALLDDGSLEHPPLEIILTVDEEAGMGGAANLDTSTLQGRRMINLDTTHEDTFFTGCAGGAKAAYTLENQWEAPGEHTAAYALRVKGLKGGHSGEEIIKERGNSLRILGRLLRAVDCEADIRIAYVHGGMKINAIPREAEAVIMVKPENAGKIGAAVNLFRECMAVEYRVSDPDLTITCESAVKKDKILNQTCGKNLIASLLLLPNGVLAMSMDIPGLVETSCNLGVLEQDEKETTIHIMPRSSVEARLWMVKELIKAAAEMTRAKAVFTGGSSPWEYNPESALRETAIHVYCDMYNEEPKVTSVHAGLECGILGAKIPGLDIISFGPNTWELHTPNEHLSISSVNRVWHFILALLKAL